MHADAAAAAAPAESYRYDAGGLRWLRKGGDGRPWLTIRLGGEVSAEYVVEPGSATPAARRETISAFGRVVAERVLATTPATIQSGARATGASAHPIVVSNPEGHTRFAVDVRTSSGPWTQLRDQVPDTSGKIVVPDSALAPGTTNFLRVKAEDDERAPWSAPISVRLEAPPAAGSANQIRTMSVTRVGTNVVLRWSLEAENGKAQLLYFTRADTGATVVVAPGLAAAARSYTLPSQALSNPCGGFSGGQRNLDQSVTDRTGETTLPAAGSASVEGGSGGCDDPLPPDPPEPAPVWVTYWHHRDHLGSLRVVTDARATAMARHDYYLFGEEVAQVGSVSARKYTGHERDEETGLDYMLARYHAVGGFLSVDPLESSATPLVPGSWNRYAYVMGNPLSLTDPTGMAGRGRGDFGGTPGQRGWQASTEDWRKTQMRAIEKAPSPTKREEAPRSLEKSGPSSGVDVGSSASKSGILLRDSNGNPVFIPVGDPVSPNPDRAGPALLQPGVLTTSNGFSIPAYMNLSDNKAWDTDCHGYSIADGKFWINDPDMAGFLATQTYLAREPVVTLTDSPALGDIVVYRSEGRVVHSAVLTGPGMVTMASGTLMWGTSKTTTVPVSKGWEYSPATIEYWTAGAR